MFRPTIVNQSCLSGSRSGLSCGESTSVTLSSPYLNLCPYSIHSAVKYQPPSLCPSLYLSLKCMVQPQSVTAQRQCVSSHPVISSSFSVFSLLFPVAAVSSHWECLVGREVEKDSTNPKQPGWRAPAAAGADRGAGGDLLKQF